MPAKVTTLQSQVYTQMTFPSEPYLNAYNKSLHSESKHINTPLFS